MELSVAVKRILESGKVEFGSRKTVENLANGGAKLVIISSNCPDKKKIEENSKIAEIPLLNSKMTSLQLGEMCGKPFLVSSICVLDAGAVNIKEITL